jgi:ABC-type methionine transport system ATPase subunit
MFSKYHRVCYLKYICDKVYVMQDGVLISDDKFVVRGENIAFQKRNFCLKFK